MHYYIFTMKNLKAKWDKLTQGWFGTVIYVILGFIIAYSVMHGLSYALNTETPVVAVFSESMVPVLQKGDMVFVYNDGTYDVGDIVVYHTQYRPYPIIHRIIEIQGENIRTKGDHNSIADPWITPVSSVYGKTAIKIPLLGWVKIIFTEITGIA